jgi:uridine phosphorylase
MKIRTGDDQGAPLVRPAKILSHLDINLYSLLVFSPYDLTLASSALPAAPELVRTLHVSSVYNAHFNGRRITLAGPAIGAPLASMVIEFLVAFGSRHLVALGSCGSLSEGIRVGHFVIPEKAFSDEGTSSHYPLKGTLVKPSSRIVEILGSRCENLRKPWTKGSVWTTDAPFRETPQKIRKYQMKKAVAVEMELSAVFKVCRFYGIEVGAILVVSDEVYSSRWTSGYRTPLYRESFITAARIALDVLSSLEEAK